MRKHLERTEKRKHRGNSHLTKIVKRQLHKMYPSEFEEVEFEKNTNSNHVSVTQSAPQTVINNNYINNQTINNNTINITINYRPYTHPDESMPTEAQMYKLLKDIPQSAPQMFKIIYLNEEVPENHVIHKNNISSNEVLVLTNNGWKRKTEREILDFFRLKYKNNIGKFIHLLESEDVISESEEEDLHDKLATQYEGRDQTDINQEISKSLIEKRTLTKNAYKSCKQLNGQELQDKLIVQDNFPNLPWVKKLDCLIKNAPTRTLSDIESEGTDC